MKYNNGFNINNIFNDEKYKARFMLAVYFIAFVVIVIFVRTSNGRVDKTDNTKNNTNNNQNTEISNVTNEKENSEASDSTIGNKVSSNELSNQFSFFTINNYHFNYQLDFGETIIIDGERYDNKIHFFTEAPQSNKKVEYFGNKEVLKVKLDNDYEIADYPYLYINIFDINTLYNIIKNSILVEKSDNIYKYKINNTDLSEYTSTESFLMVNRDDSIYNDITVTLLNNKVSSIELNFTNLLSSNSDYNKLEIMLKYDKFAQISDFNIDF